MEPIDYESEYEEIVKVLQEHEGKLDYRTLNETLADKISIDSINAEFKKDTKIEDQSIQIGLIINS